MSWASTWPSLQILVLTPCCWSIWRLRQTFLAKGPDVCPEENTHFQTLLWLGITFKCCMGVFLNIFTEIHFTPGHPSVRQPRQTFLVKWTFQYYRAISLMDITFQHCMGVFLNISTEIQFHSRSSVSAAAWTVISSRREFFLLQSNFHVRCHFWTLHGSFFKTFPLKFSFTQGHPSVWRPGQTFLAEGTSPCYWAIS